LGADHLERPRAPVAALALVLALAAPAAARADDRALLERYRPVYVHDARDSSPVAGVAASPPASYGRAVAASGGGRWLQYWRWHADNPQDRGILRTGRHEGDWELVQVRVDRAGRAVEAVYAQHSGAERCGWPSVRTQAGAPVAYLANGSHAAYFRAGVRDRTFPDPNDEARGDGRREQPRLVVISAREPSWMRFSGRWGTSRARWPAEQSSPRGPAFQGVRWDDPGAFAASARGCMAGRCDAVGECDARELALAGAAAGALGLLVLLGVWRRRRRA
jgi:hypothetical protein